MKQVAFVIDPIETFNVAKDSTLAMMQAALDLDLQVYFCQSKQLYAAQGKVFAEMQQLLQIDLAATPWYQCTDVMDLSLDEIDVLVMRQDPPFDMHYIYATYLLELARQQGVRVLNDPRSIRDCNEKFFIHWFPHCITDTLVTADETRLRDFLVRVQDIIVKPLDGMGGRDIFRLRLHDPNISAVLQHLTKMGVEHVMAQRYLPEVKQGDKRILLIGGEPVPYALARIPAEGETRANLAAGGRGQAVALTARDQWLCEQVGPELRARGLWFVGLDVIGDYITEINVTSPTCIRELDTQCDLQIARDFWLSVQALNLSN